MSVSPFKAGDMSDWSRCQSFHFSRSMSVSPFKAGDVSESIKERADKDI